MELKKSIMKKGALIAGIIIVLLATRADTCMVEANALTDGLEGCVNDMFNHDKTLNEARDCIWTYHGAAWSMQGAGGNPARKCRESWWWTKAHVISLQRLCMYPLDQEELDRCIPMIVEGNAMSAACRNDPACSI